MSRNGERPAFEAHVALVVCVKAALSLGCIGGEPPPPPAPPPELPPAVERATYRARGLDQDRRYLLYLPEAPPESGSVDLVLVLPGIGADPERTLGVLPDLHRGADRHGFALVVADSTGYLGGSRFVRENRLDELHREYLFGLVDHVAVRLADEHGWTVGRRFVIGSSAGGAGAWRMVLARPQYWAGLGLVVPAGAPFEERVDELRHLRVAFLQGDRDTAIDVGWNRRAVERLSEAGVAVLMIEVPGAGHRVARTRGLPELLEFLLW